MEVRAWEQFTVQMEKLPIRIIDDCYTLPQIQDRAAELAAEMVRVRAIHVDYRDLVELGGQDKRDGRYAVEAVSRGMKLLAKDLTCTVVCAGACQRPAKGGDGKPKQYRPELESGRESGRIEYDADVIILLARNIASAEKETRRTLEYRVAKLRRGRVMSDFQQLRLNLATLKITDTKEAKAAVDLEAKTDE